MPSARGLCTEPGRAGCDVVFAVYRRQTASSRLVDGSESTPPTHLRCAMLNIEVGRRRANRIYDPCRLRMG